MDLVTDRRIFEKRISKPTFKRGQEISEDLCAVQCYVSTVLLNKPIYCGFTVLELSKTLMYNFHYNHMKVKYPGDKLQLMFTDTDSLAYAVETEDVYEDMWDDVGLLYDFSGYPDAHVLRSDENKKVLGKFKDELNGVPMEEFVGLRSKCYSMLFDGGKENKRAAGVKRAVVKHKLRHLHYLKTLELCTPTYVVQNNIVSKKHTLRTVNQTKIGLNAFDVKRYILENGVDTLAYGHYEAS